MQHTDTLTRTTNPRLILVHGSWHTGECWADVLTHLAAAGVDALAPTLPGHGADGAEQEVSHADYVGAVLDVLDSLDEPAVLVGHSFGGSVISRVAELRPHRCRGLVYYSAFVPRDGESVADSLPPQFIAFLDQAASANANRMVALSDELVREAFANTADEATLTRIRSMLVPEPHGPIFERLELLRFDWPANPERLHPPSELPTRCASSTPAVSIERSTPSTNARVLTGPSIDGPPAWPGSVSARTSCWPSSIGSTSSHVRHVSMKPCRHTSGEPVPPQ